MIIETLNNYYGVILNVDDYYSVTLNFIWFIIYFRKKMYGSGSRPVDSANLMYLSLNLFVLNSMDLDMNHK